MQIAVLLYEGFTALDAIGPYQALSPIPEAEVVFVAEHAGPLTDDNGTLTVTPRRTLAEVRRPDIAVVPGSPMENVERQMDNPVVVDWLRTVDAGSTWTTSVCTGALLLAKAGLLDGRRATTHWLAVDALKRFGAEATGERVVFDGKYVTAAGVSAGIDMGLTLAGKLAGDQYAQGIQLMIEYDPQPPYDAGSPEKAPSELVEYFRHGGARAFPGGAGDAGFAG